mmetsp:Transcript_17101/g.47725  ORF Transcript_17101/g.47725 Transcript_17101/m.47725 type:complete len:213 (-) Transcript_17101:576-1214(-)
MGRYMTGNFSLLRPWPHSICQSLWRSSWLQPCRLHQQSHRRFSPPAWQPGRCRTWRSPCRGLASPCAPAQRGRRELGSPQPRAQWQRAQPRPLRGLLGRSSPDRVPCGCDGAHGKNPASRSFRSLQGTRWQGCIPWHRSPAQQRQHQWTQRSSHPSALRRRRPQTEPEPRPRASSPPTAPPSVTGKTPRRARGGCGLEAPHCASRTPQPGAG